MSLSSVGGLCGYKSGIPGVVLCSVIVVFLFSPPPSLVMCYPRMRYLRYLAAIIHILFPHPLHRVLLPVLYLSCLLLIVFIRR